MALTATPAAAWILTKSAEATGFVLAAQGVGRVVSLPFAGVVGDRYPRRVVMVLADLLRFGSQGLAALLLISGRAEIWQLFVTQFCLGTGTAFFNAAEQGITPEVVPKGRLLAANSLKESGGSFLRIAGPGIGGYIAAVFGSGWGLGIDAASFMASGVLLMRMPLLPSRETTGDALPRSPHARWMRRKWPEIRRALNAIRRFGHKEIRAWFRMWLKDLKDGWQVFRSKTWLWVVVVAFTVINAVALAPFFVLAPTVAETTFGGADAWGWMLAALTGGEVVGGILVGMLHPQRPLLVAMAVSVLWVIPLVALTTASLGLVLMAAGIGGISGAMFQTIWITTLQSQIDDEHRSRIGALDELGGWAVVPFGYAGAGILKESLGTDPLVLGAAVVLIATTLVALLVPSVRGLKAAEDEADNGVDANGASGDLPSLEQATEPVGQTA